MPNPQGLPPLYVVFSTGRSGSTLLSDILAAHPDILSVSEFLVGLLTAGVRHRDQQITAHQFCQILHAANPSRAALTRAGIDLPENRYPFDRMGMRYKRGDIIPSALYATLPLLTRNPDPLFDGMLRYIETQSGQTAGQHIAAVFEYLLQVKPSSVIVERSGGTLAFARQIQDLLPDAHSIVLLRDGQSTVLSMRNHSFFRHVALRWTLFRALGYDPYLHTGREKCDTLPPALLDVLPETFTAESFARLDLPLNIFGSLWFNSIEEGLRVLTASTPWFRFEDLCNEQTDFLTKFAKVLGVPANPDWLGTAKSLIKTPTPQLANLSVPERENLQKACEAGQDILAKLKDKP